MQTERPILVLTASAGAGHMVAAQAIDHALRARLPTARVETVDVLQRGNSFFRTLYATGYLGLVTHAPVGMGVLYEAMDRPDHAVRDTWRVRFQNVNMRPVMRWLSRCRPRLIINTHFLPAELVAGLRRDARLACPQVTVTTDFETHRMWAQDPTERYYTATELGKAYLQTWGVDAERILVTGIPVRPGFERPCDAAQARRDHGLDSAGPVVLLLCGGFGVGPTAELLRELMRVQRDATIVVICGRNESLRARLDRVAERAGGPVHVLGFTDRMHEWMRIADLIVSKPGGLTVAEALVCEAVLVVVSPIPGQETRNADFLLEHGAAIKVNNPRLLGYRVRELLDDRDRLSRLRAAARKLGRPGAAARIVEDALSLLESPAELTSGPVS